MMLFPSISKSHISKSRIQITQPLIPASKRLKFILLFSLVTIFSLTIGTKIAIAVGAGTFNYQGIVDLNFAGGLIAGGMIGLSQWLTLSFYRSSVERERCPMKGWIIVTSVGWAIAVSFDWKWVSPWLEANSLLGKDWFSPVTFGLLAVAQWFVLRRQVKQSYLWLLIPFIQILFICLLQLGLEITAFGIFVLLLSNMANPSATSTLLFDAVAFLVNHFGLLAHSLIPAIALCALPKKL